ncbi:MAG: hypothetical protein SNJ58_13945 [Aggregatilineales bacterium]
MTARAEISFDDLPTWMRPRRRLPDLGILVALAFAAIIALPLLVRSSVPPYSAVPLHALRAAETARLLQEGILYPRWASNFHFTYGAPVLNYLPPLPHTLAALHQIITEATPTQSVKTSMLIGWAAAAVGMYAFGRGRFGVRGGVLAAISYLMSAPLAFTLPYQLGEAPYLLALGLLPCAAAAIDALWRAGNRQAFGLALLLCVAFCLCDSRVTLFGGAVLGFAALSGRIYAPAQVRLQRALYLVALVALTALLSAFYWLPALSEREAVRWLSAGAPPYAAPIPLNESLLGTPHYDLSAQNPPVLRSVGLGTVLAACLGLAIGKERRQVGVFVGLGAALVALSTPAFGRLWQAQDSFLPILPYHAVLVSAFCWAAAAGGAGQGCGRGLGGAIRLGGLAVVPLVPMCAAFFPPAWAEYSSGVPFTAFESELLGYHAASLREGVLLPAAVSELPRPLPSLIENLRLGRPADRVNRATLGSGGQISPIAEGGLTWRYVINTLESNLVEFFFHAGPSWRAYLQGKSVPLSTSPSGFIQLALPPINAELILSVEETPASQWAWALTGTGVLSALFLLRRLPKAQSGSEKAALRLERPEQFALIGVVVLAQALALVIRWQPNLILPRSQRGSVLGEMTPLPRFSQAGIDSLGYHLPGQTVQRGELLSLTFYWQAARPLLELNQSEVRLIDVETGEIVARSGRRHVGGVPTLAWQLTGYIRDDLQLSIPLSLRPGSYLLKVGLGVCSQPLPLPCEGLRIADAYDSQGRVERDGIVIPQIIRVE